MLLLFDTISLLLCMIRDNLEDGLMNLGFHNHVCKNKVAPGRSVRFGRGSVFPYSRYSMGSLRGEAPHNSRVGGLGEGGSPPP